MRIMFISEQVERINVLPVLHQHLPRIYHQSVNQ